jgi:hypothetical protein
MTMAIIRAASRHPAYAPGLKTRPRRVRGANITTSTADHHSVAEKYIQGVLALGTANCILAKREGLLGAARLAPSAPPFGRYPRFVAASVS